MVIRKAARKDELSLIELIERTGETREKAVKRVSSVNSDGRLILVLEENSKLIGYVRVSQQDQDQNVNSFVDLAHYACLNWIGVDPDFRKRGNGSKLVLSCDEIAKEWHKVGIWLDCRGKVIPFYTSNGYKIRGSYFDEEKPRYVMAKKFS